MLSISECITYIDGLHEIARLNYDGPMRAKLELDREYWHGVANGLQAALNFLKSQTEEK